MANNGTEQISCPNDYNIHVKMEGPALMVVWSKTLPLTASCLSQCHYCPGSNPTRACDKVASDLGLVGGLRVVLRFPPPVKTG